MRYGFIGAGNIATAIIKGMLSKDAAKPSEIFIFDANPAKQEQLCGELSVTAYLNAVDLARQSDVIFLAVKPNVVQSVLEEIRECVREHEPIIISVAAGKTLDFINAVLGFDTPVIRVMPNTNAIVGESMSILCFNSSVNEDQKNLALNCFNSIGRTYIADESQMSVFTALCSCSPAFSFLFIDSLAKAAHKAGIDKKTALTLAAQAVFGSAKTVLESGEHPWQLIDRVCSPGGSTIEGICALEDNRFESAVVAAVDASINKDKKL